MRTRRRRHFLANLAQPMAQLQASLQDRHNRLQKLAITDDLTGLYNAEVLQALFVGDYRAGAGRCFPVTLLLFDIDNFKRYNDEFGHGVGDEILEQTAALIKRCCREHDHVARMGGTSSRWCSGRRKGRGRRRTGICRPATARRRRRSRCWSGSGGWSRARSIQ